jgi:hypothetical protein
MTPHRLLNWTLATLIALLLASAHLLDGPSEIEAAQDSAADVAAAQADARAAAQATRVARHQPTP